MTSPLDMLAKKAKGEVLADEYDASAEDGVALTKKLFKAWEGRDAEEGYDILCQIIALKSGAPHAAE